MKPSKTLLFFLLLLSGSFVSAQEADFDARMSRRAAFSCEEIAETSSLLFCDYVKRNDVDSASMVVSYWSARCFNSEAVFRAKILLAIKAGAYSDALVSVDMGENMLRFKKRLATERGEISLSEAAANPAYYSYLPPGSSFDLFTRRWFTEMKAELDENSIEYLWCEFYGGETSGTIRAMSKQNENIAPVLVNEAKRLKNFGDRGGFFNMAFLAGVWMPVGELSAFGPHSEMGFQMGGQSDSFMLDFTLLFRSSDTRNPYTYKRYIEGSRDGYVSRQSNSFGGTYLGLDFGYVAYKKKRHQIDALAGVGYDAITEIGSDDDYGYDYSYALEGGCGFVGFWNHRSASYNINIGVGYRYLISRSLYLGVKAKYNFVDYSDRHLIDYKGSPFTVHFTLGGLFTNRKNQEKRNWVNY